MTDPIPPIGPLGGDPGPGSNNNGGTIKEKLLKSLVAHMIWIKKENPTAYQDDYVLALAAYDKLAETGSYLLERYFPSPQAAAQEMVTKYRERPR